MKNKIMSPSLLLLALFALFNLFASGRWTWALAAWLSTLFGLRYMHSNQNRKKYLYLYLALWLTLSISWYGGTPIWGIAHFIFMAVNSLIAAIPFFLDSILASRLRRGGRLPFIATFIFPLVGTTMEFLLSSSSPIGNFGAAGYSQYGLPWLTQITSVTGMLGLTFLVSWLPSVANWAWDNNFQWQRIRLGVSISVLVLLLVVGFGAVRLATAPPIDAQETVAVASFTIAETDIPALNETLSEQGPDAFSRQTSAVHAQYLAMSEQAIADGAQIILWPELAVSGLEQDVQATIQAGQTLAQEAGIYLAMPTFTFFPGEERQAENVLFVAGPQGQIEIEHVKYGGNILEGSVKGSADIETISTEYGRLAGIICWDTNYPNIVRQVGRQETDILLSPAKEWDGINPLHAEMAAFRALENGTAVVRQADDGLSVVFDAYGRTLASGEGVVESGNYLLVNVPTNSPTTLYPIIGEVVGIISLIALLALIILAWLRGREGQAEDAQPAVTAS